VGDWMADGLFECNNRRCLCFGSVSGITGVPSASLSINPVSRQRGPARRSPIYLLERPWRGLPVPAGACVKPPC
jgi:hypothetical protein